MDKQRFLKIYANLPINLRDEVVFVHDQQGPITWKVAYLEINKETKLGEKINQKLIEMEII